MSSAKSVLAFDFGASSGRAIRATFDGQKISLEEVHRFSNDPVIVNGTMYWDVLRLYHEIKQGLLKGNQAGGFESVGFDTWGVDFGLIDEDGRLLENPIHYRDVRNNGMIEESDKIVPKKEQYDVAGIQFLTFNTIFQLLSLVQNRPELLERADKLIFMPDLFIYFLTGKKQSEYTVASTGAMLDAQSGEWAADLMKKMGIPERLLCDLVQPGTFAGNISDAVCKELTIPTSKVVSIASHDTASAVVAVPAKAEEDFIYISSGTWSLMGTECKEPVLSEAAFQRNFTNEGGFGKTIRLLKNIMGLWLIQESRRQWIREGENVTFADLEREALASEPFKCFINPDDPEFMGPGDMPNRIRDYCKRTGQAVPESRGSVMRCIYESLALAYRNTKAGIEEITGKKYNAIHVVGGGTKDRLLSQFTANAAACEVVAGPIEATALGNIAVQLIANGAIKDLQGARDVIANSFDLLHYQPKDTEAWDAAFERFQKLLG
jgi:rhamnulokinase